MEIPLLKREIPLADKQPLGLISKVFKGRSPNPEETIQGPIQSANGLANGWATRGVLKRNRGESISTCPHPNLTIKKDLRSTKGGSDVLQGFQSQRHNNVVGSGVGRSNRERENVARLQTG